jgi:glyoxylase-like metal-dependent hydrolase (beta-lactamase superfamily II)
MATAPLIFETFPVGPLQCNCTILGDPTSHQAIVIDPGGDAERILERLKVHNLSVSRILHTHAHFDHFLASGQLREATGAPLALHKEDKPLWDILERQCAMFSIPYTPVPDPDTWLEHEEELKLPGCVGCALHTPGHTPGSMSFSFPEQKLLVAGDTLFRHSVGRTDLWGGDPGAIVRSIREQLYTLDEATQVVTGHGPMTFIGEEVRQNPFVRPA